MPRPRRFFPPEDKAEVVELFRSTGKTVGQVARALDLTQTAVGQGSAKLTWTPATAMTASPRLISRSCAGYAARSGSCGRTRDLG